MEFHKGMLAAAIAALATSAAAQSYPDRPIEITVPFSPGAVTDVLGRALADGLSHELGQRVLVINKAGATGGIGTAAVARAAPDGYSLLFTAAVSMTVLPLTNRQAGYDHKSFVPICQTFKNQMVIVVKPDSPFRSVADLVAAAKQKPGAINFGHLGVASIPHLAMIEFSQAAKVEFNAIPFKGDADVMQQVMGGQVDFGAVVLSSAAPSGLRILGLFADQRNPSTPDTPTVKEQGFAVAPSSFGGLSAPAGISAEVRRRLGDACKMAAQGERYAKLAHSVFQPTDYYADGASFAHSLDLDVADKARLLATLGDVR
ncbi:MAG TPA: tripartite tricarboxylate transporter substrate binding protein [Xanthobacteraceae bacterium]